MKGNRKPGLTIEEHRSIAARLKPLYADLQGIQSQLGAAYRKNANPYGPQRVPEPADYDPSI